MTPIFMFPGQSSRDPAMIERALAFAAAHGVSGALSARVDHASSVVGRDLRAHYRAGNSDVFAANRDVQVGVFLANQLWADLLAARGVTAACSLGLSLGEYNHLVHVGALSFEAALRLVDRRGEAFDRGPDGMMAAVFPVAPEPVAAIVERARAGDCLEIASLNSPRQQVLAGDRAAVDRALALLEEEVGVEAVVIERRLPIHCRRFAPVAREFRAALTRAPWRIPRRPYLPNLVGRFVVEPGPLLLHEILARHVYRPVRWRASLEFLGDRFPDAVFIEVGPGRVLSNLLARKWLPNRRFRTDHEEDAAGEWMRLVEEVGHGIFA